MNSILSKLRKIKSNIDREKYFKFSLMLIVIFSFSFSLFLSSRQQVWFDESYSIWITKNKTISETINITSVDAHPPFYYILLNIWGRIFNFNIMSLRALSIIFFAVSILFIGLFVKKIYGKKVATVVSLLMVFSPFLLRYSYEIRMYSLASFIALISTILFCKIMRGGGQKKSFYWLYYGLSVLIGMYTLYTLAFVFFSHFIIAIYSVIKNKDYKIWQKEWFKAYVFAVLCYLPWIPSFKFQLENSASSGIGDYFSFNVAKNMFDFVFFYKPGWEYPLGFTLITALFIFVIIKRGLFNKKDKKINRNFFVVFWSAILPFIIIAILSQPFILKKPFFVERYMSQYIILFYLVFFVAIARMLLKVKDNKAIISIITAIILFTGVSNLASAGNFNYQNYRESNAGDNMAKISTICGNHLIVMDDIYLFMELEVYNKQCDMNIFTDNHNNYGGGYAPINKYKKRIYDIDNLDNFYVVMNKDKYPEFTGVYRIENIKGIEFSNLSMYKVTK